MKKSIIIIPEKVQKELEEEFEASRLERVEIFSRNSSDPRFRSDWLWDWSIHELREWDKKYGKRNINVGNYSQQKGEKQCVNKKWSFIKLLKKIKVL
jgi:hypothetical protein